MCTWPSPPPGCGCGAATLPLLLCEPGRSFLARYYLGSTRGRGVRGPPASWSLFLTQFCGGRGEGRLAPRGRCAELRFQSLGKVLAVEVAACRLGHGQRLLPCRDRLRLPAGPPKRVAAV